MPSARFAAAFLAGLLLPAASRADGPGLARATPEMLRAPRVEPAPGFSAEGMEAVFYDALPWKGKPTRTFAWIGMPRVEPGAKVPGIVLVHGGGGTAFEDWVRLWTGRGYAAIAMDTCGTVPRGSYGKWDRHDAGGPPGPDFAASDQPVEDQWPYHAAADLILAHSLLRSRPEVDPNRIGLTGISWGGYLTCLVSGLDDRFRFAVPVYGCGFLGENSTWKPELEKLGERGQRWLDLWDPKHYLPHGKMPKLWVTGTNDFAYPLDSLMKSVKVAGGSSTLCIRPRMPHGHGGAGENPEEIHAFADGILRGGKSLASFDYFESDGNILSVGFRGEIPITKLELMWTKDSGPWKDRRWEATEVPITAKATNLFGDPIKIPAGTGTAPLPFGSTASYWNLTDQRGLVVSSRFWPIKTGQGD
ncbi:alpha/beta hydrolase family protein [Tundrisphaera sp. TA3]|uniref:alpha/beta hydrolase family protein n=1 Tax=Tundrisphaera sp. TA3 TaxID=3435775 RepID=UPI003EB7C763